VQGIAGGGGSIPGSDNEVLTSNGSGGATAESNLTFDGSTLDLIGSTAINGNSRFLNWTSGTTFWAGGWDISATTAIAEEGVSSVNAGATLSGWTEVKYNGTVLTNQLNDATAKSPGQLITLRSNGTWEVADADTSNSTWLLGICLDTADANFEAMHVLIEGQVSTPYHNQLASSNPGAPLYVSPTAGYVTETAPSTPGQFVRLIGHNIYDTEDTVVIRFDPDNSWIEL
jgi:hypothetical protein